MGVPFRKAGVLAKRLWRVHTANRRRFPISPPVRRFYSRDGLEIFEGLPMRNLIVACLAYVASVFVAADSRAAPAGWTLLGSQTVDFGRDQDTIQVGENRGRFRRIMFRVTGGDIEMDKMVIVFGNGTKFEPGTRLHFEAPDRSRSINLPGDERIIRRISFIYRSLQKDRHSVPATITVYGY